MESEERDVKLIVLLRDVKYRGMLYEEAIGRINALFFPPSSVNGVEQIKKLAKTLSQSLWDSYCVLGTLPHVEDVVERNLNEHFAVSPRGTVEGVENYEIGIVGTGSIGYAPIGMKSLLDKMFPDYIPPSELDCTYYSQVC